MTFASENSLIGYLDDNDGRVLSIPNNARQNILTLGELGSGKSSILRLLILQDIRQRRGFILVENHSELSGEVLSMIPPDQYDNIVYVNLTSIKKFEKTFRFNPLENDNPLDAGMVALNFTECLAKAFSDSWGARVETCARNGALGVIGTNSNTLGAMLNLLTDKDFRETFIPQIQNRQSKDFFNNVYDKQYPKEAGGVIFNKLNKMLTIPELDAMFNVKKSSIDFKTMLDDGKYVVIDLGGGLPNDMVKFLGNVFMHLFYVRYKKRERGSDGTFAPFNLYLDEVQMFSAPMVRELLNTVRKYGIKATIATQSISALDKDLADEIMTLCRAIACFRCDAKTAMHLKSVLPVSPEKQQQLSFHSFSFYAAGDKPTHAVARTKHLNIPARHVAASQYSVSHFGEFVSLEKYYAQSGGNTDVLLTPLEFGILNLLRTENRDMTKDEIVQAITRRYAVTSRQVASALLDTLMAANNFVVKKDVSDDDGDHRFESRYVITTTAHKRVFSNAAVGRRSGGDLHLSAIFFVMNVQMNLGRYCIPDLGKTTVSKADLMIYSPRIVKPKDGVGAELYNPLEWSEDTVAVEVEASPSKHPKQIPINWKKNTKMGHFVWFIVFNEKDMGIVQKALRGAGIDKKGYALQVLDKKALESGADRVLSALTEAQSVVYEIIISKGGSAQQNVILEKAYRYNQKDIVNALADLESKKRLLRIGSSDANLQNPGAKIVWALPGVGEGAAGNSGAKDMSDKNTVGGGMVGDGVTDENATSDDDDAKEDEDVVSDDDGTEEDEDTASDDDGTEEDEDTAGDDDGTEEDKDEDTASDEDTGGAYKEDKKLEQSDKVSPLTDPDTPSQNDQQTGHPDDKGDSLDDLTEPMLLCIWESYMDSDSIEQAKRISDEINTRGFVIRKRNGSYHIARKPRRKKK